MENKQIEVTCPCCETRLAVDVLTQKVLKTTAPDQVDETGKAKLDLARWDSAARRVEGRGTRAEDRLESALSAERDKESRLDDLFERAKDKVQRRSDQDEEEDA